MRIIQFGLLILSILQFSILESFWEGSFFYLFIWIILFQLLWFYIERPMIQKGMFIFILLLSIINIISLPQIPYFMIGLLALELPKYFSLKMTALVLLIILGSSFGFLATQEQLLTFTEFGLVLTIIGLCLWVAKQDYERKKQEQNRYKLIQLQEELKEDSELLKIQMESLEEFSRINERNRISRDLHDSVGHTLSTIVIQLAAIEKITRPAHPQVAQMLEQLHQFTKDGLTNVREVIHKVKPDEYQKMAFVDRLQILIKEFEQNTQIQVLFNANQTLWLLNDDQEMLVYRAIQEFLGNSSKHSQATEIRIQYHFTPTSLLLTMQDNGEGTDTIVPKMGLSGMEERAKLLGGKVSIHSASGDGFRVRIVLPKGGFINDTRRN